MSVGTKKRVFDSPTADLTSNPSPIVIPTPQVKPQLDSATTTTTTPSITDSYLNRLKVNQQSAEKLIGQGYDLSLKQYKPMIDRLNQDISTEEANRESAIQAEKNRAEAETNRYNEDVGQQEKDLAQTRIDNENRNRARFGTTGSGAFDAGGVGSYTAAQQRNDTAFQGDLAKLKSKAISDRVTISSNSTNKIAELTRAATQAIRGYRDKLSQIQNSQDLNPIEKQQAILMARKEYDATVANIQEQTAVKNANNLSAEFLRTGIPTNAYEVEFLQKNKDAMASMNGSASTVGDVVDAIRQISEKDLGSIYGWASVDPRNKLPESPAQLAQAKVDKLKSLLQLAAAGKLKGQGSITENERKILADSTTLLNKSGISPKQASVELQKLLATYQAKGMGQNTVTSSDDPLGLGL